MKPIAESSKAADTERFEREVGVWHPPKETGGISAALVQQADRNFGLPTQQPNQGNTTNGLIHNLSTGAF